MLYFPSKLVVFNSNIFSIDAVIGSFLDSQVQFQVVAGSEIVRLHPLGMKNGQNRPKTRQWKFSVFKINRACTCPAEMEVGIAGCYKPKPPLETINGVYTTDCLKGLGLCNEVKHDKTN